MLAPNDDILELDNDISLVVDSLEQRFIKQNKSKIKKNGIISDLFDKEILSSLELIFSNGKIGHQTLTIIEFKEAIVQYIPVHLVENICRSIDVNDSGFVNYPDFINYLITSEQGTSFSNRTNASKFVLQCQQDQDTSVIHRDFIDCICYTKKPHSMVITGGRDGQVSIWNLDDLRLVSNLNHRNKNRVYEEELYKNMDSLLKAQCAKYSTSYQNGRESKVAITSMLVLHNTGMLCVGSADSCVTLYDLSSHEVCGRIKYLEFIPTALTYFYRPPLMKYTMNNHNPLNPILNNNQNNQQNVVFTSNEAEEDLLRLHLSIGDSSGKVYIIQLHAEFSISIDAGMKKKAYALFTQSAQENLSICNAGSHWITELKYVSEVDSLLVSAVDGVIHFLDLHKLTVGKAFNGHRCSHSGVRAFSWSPFGKYVASSADRVLLFWDIFTLEVVGMIDNLKSPLIAVDINDAEFKIVAILVNKSIMVWHSITYEFQQQISDPTSYKPSDNLASMCYIPEQHILLTAGNKITSWKLERSLEGPIEAEATEDLCATLYNSLFNQVVVVKSFGTVKVYQCETGAIVRQFNVLPQEYNSSELIPLKIDSQTGLYLPVIKSACLDKLQSRLIITSYDLSIQFWSVTDGTNLIQFYPQLYPYSMSKLYSHLPRVATVVDYDTLYTNVKQTNSHVNETARNASKSKAKYVLLGTQNGNICGYQEMNSSIDDSPSFFLRFYEINIATRDNIPVTTTAATTIRKPSTILQPTIAEKTLSAKARITQPHIPPNSRRSTVTTQTVARHRLGSQLITSKYVNNNSNSNIGVDKGIQPIGDGDNSLINNKSKDMLVEQARDIVKIDNPILWMQSVEDTNLLLAGYSNGAVVVWNLESFSRIKDLDVSQSGPILNGMRMKGEKNINRGRVLGLSSNPLASPVPSVTSNTDRSNTANVQNGTDNNQTNNDNNNMYPQLQELKTTTSIEENNATSSQNKTNNIVNNLETISDSDTGNDGSKKRKSGNKSRGRKTNMRLASSSALLARQNRRKSTAILQRILNVSNASTKRGGGGEDVGELSSDNEGDGSDTGSESVVSSRNPSFAIQSREHSISVANTTVSGTNNNGESDVNEIDMDKLDVNAAITPFEGEEEVLLTNPTITTILLNHRTNTTIVASKNDSASIVTTELASKRSNNFTKHRRITVSMDPLQNMRKQTTNLYPQSIITVNHNNIEEDNDDLRSIMKTNQCLDDVDKPDESPAPVDHSGSARSTTDKIASNDIIDSNKVSVGVDSLLMLPNTFVIIGACSDKYLRFWDLNTAHILCSCLYYVPNERDQIIPGQPETSSANPNEILRILKTSDSEDALIGGYDSGMIRVWAIQSYSLVTLKGLLSRHLNTGKANMNNNQTDIPFGNILNSTTSSSSFGTGTMAISPIILMHQWNAHTSPLISIEYIWFNSILAPNDEIDEEESYDESVANSSNPVAATQAIATTATVVTGKDGTTSSANSTLIAHSQSSPITSSSTSSLTKHTKKDLPNNSPITLQIGITNPTILTGTSPIKKSSDLNSSSSENNRYGMKIKREKQSDMGQFLLDGFILSAGTDQRVILWNITGKCVGLFGSYGWDINYEKTWQREIEKGMNAKKKKPFQEQKSQLRRMNHEDLTNANNITISTTNPLVRSPSTRTIENIMKQSQHTSADLNTYVQIFTKKVAHKPAHSNELNKNFHDIMTKHPMVDVSKAPDRMKSKNIN